LETTNLKQKLLDAATYTPGTIFGVKEIYQNEKSIFSQT
jgi:hypothetical protein